MALTPSSGDAWAWVPTWNVARAKRFIMRSSWSVVEAGLIGVMVKRDHRTGMVQSGVRIPVTPFGET